MKPLVSTDFIFSQMCLWACSSEDCEPSEWQSTATVTIQVAQPSDNLLLMISPAKPGWGDFDAILPAPGEPLAVVPANQAEISLELEDYDGPLFEAQGSSSVFFLLSTFLDLNGDGEHQVGEPFEGLSDTVLAYFGTVGCEEWRGFFVPGWNAIEPRDPSPAPASFNPIRIDNTLRLNQELILDLAMSQDDRHRVVIAPESIWTDNKSLAPLIDRATSDTLEIVFPEVLPEEHLQDVDIAGDTYSDWFFGVHWPLLIEDLNGSGHFDSEDQVTEAFCSASSEAPMKIGHYPEADTLEDALFFKRSGRQPGWGLYKDLEGTWTWVDPEDLDTLTPGSCPLP